LRLVQGHLPESDHTIGVSVVEADLAGAAR
jgi:hypothetical protein